MTPSPTIALAARRQLAIGAALLGVLAAITAAAALLAGSPAVLDWIEARKLAYAARTRTIYSYERGYTDFEDRMTLAELPAIDASRGGVYFIGSSNLKWGLDTWTLPAAEQARVHNLGIGGTSHTMQAALVRFLVERIGLLRAGGERSLFVFGGSYHCAGHLDDDRGFFASLWRRHGVYTYAPDTGIDWADAPPLLRALRSERAHVAGFLQGLGRELARGLAGEAVRVHDAARYNEARRTFMGEDWAAKIERQSDAFVRTARDLRARGAAVTLVLLPQGSWEANLPFHAAYTARMREVCAAHGIPVVDLGDLLEDEDFADSNHFNPAGQTKFTARVMDLARAHLRATGALP